MTTEEIRKTAWEVVAKLPFEITVDDNRFLRNRITAAMTEAVAAERERCAKIARRDHAYCDCPNGGRCKVAAAIRGVPDATD